MRWAFLTGGVLLVAAPAHAASVLSIGDGDTITVTEGRGHIKVRLACIDAPETSQSPYGMEARRALQGLLPIGSQVTLRTKATDRYGRSIAEVHNGSTNIKQFLIDSVNACVYWQHIAVVIARPTSTWRRMLA
jgi:endonuclease YncB( thermonuclease family)